MADRDMCETMLAAEDSRRADERFMAEALEEARRALEEGEVPIGAVVVCDGRVVARAHNRREQDADPSSHAEFQAMLAAARALGRWRLTGCTVYVTLEPCCMCAGLMVNARVDRCVYGAADPKGGALGTLYALNRDERLNHAFPVTAGVCEEECSQILRSFFAELRARAASPADEAAVPRPACVAPAAAPVTLPAPHVLLAIDSFKGSASSEQVAAWAAEGVRHVCPDAAVRVLPVADGGEGTIDALSVALAGEVVERTVTGPMGAPVAARYVLARRDGETVAVIEMAEAAGIGYSPRTLAAAHAATTFGVGELVRDAIERGARSVHVALGGSATNDGGAGFLQALGCRLLDEAGRDIEPGLAGLEHLQSVDLAPAYELFGTCALTILSDVDNPLVGARGALAVFGPQKGLTEGIETCDAWMVRYGQALDAARASLGDRVDPDPAGRRFHSVLGVPGAGAAGGLGAAILSLGARMMPGIEAVLDLVDFDEAVAHADVVITGEGNMDEQSAAGKTPVGVARRAKRWRKPVIALVGGRAENLDAVYREGIDLVLPVVRRPMALDQALLEEEARCNVVCAGEAAMRAYLMARLPR